MKKIRSSLICIAIILILITIILYSICSKPEKFTEEKNKDLLLSKDVSFEPYNTFEKIPNPVNSKEVLVQSSIPEKFYTEDTPELRDSYFKISNTINPGSTYKLSAWSCVTPSWNGTDNLFNIKYFEGDKVKTISTDGQVVKNLELGKNKWKYKICKVDIPVSAKNLIEIYLGYKPSNTEGQRYITDVQLEKFKTPDLDINSKSVSNEHRKLLKNLSSDKSLSLKAESNIINKDNVIKTYGNKFTSTLKNIKDEFTLLLYFKVISCDDSKDIFNIKGLKLNISNCILYLDKHNIKKINKDNKILLSVAFKNDKAYIDVDGTTKTIDLKLNSKDITINEDRKAHLDIYQIKVYNEFYDENKIKKLKSELLNNKEETYENYENNSKFTEDFNRKNNLSSRCPKIQYNSKENKYFFEIDPKHQYAITSGTSGRRLLGQDMETANQEYKTYFPNCPEQELYSNKVDINSCMFKPPFTKSSPCGDCPELLNYKQNSKVDLSNKCKASIRSHCNNKVSSKVDINKFENICKPFHPIYSKDPVSQQQLFELHNDLLNVNKITHK